MSALAVQISLQFDELFSGTPGVTGPASCQLPKKTSNYLPFIGNGLQIGWLTSAHPEGLIMMVGNTLQTSRLLTIQAKNSLTMFVVADGPENVTCQQQAHGRFWALQSWLTSVWRPIQSRIWFMFGPSLLKVKLCSGQVCPPGVQKAWLGRQWRVTWLLYQWRLWAKVQI